MRINNIYILMNTLLIIIIGIVLIIIVYGLIKSVHFLNKEIKYQREYHKLKSIMNKHCGFKRIFPIDKNESVLKCVDILKSKGYTVIYLESDNYIGLTIGTKKYIFDLPE